MNIDRIKDIANAVLYEGYILYPYRPSSIKNRQRWTFGGIFPAAFGGGNGDATKMQTQILLQGDSQTKFEVRVRFLHVLAREIGKLSRPVARLPETGEADFALTGRLEVNGQEFLAWEEAIEREIDISDLGVDLLASAPRKTPFAFEGGRSLEPLRDADGTIVAVLIRTALAIQGVIEIAADRLSENAFRITVRIENITPLSAAEVADRGKAQRRAFASTHTILGSRDGAFVSLLDPPEDLRDAAARCDNQGSWPVLVGKEGDRDAMLSSPIILYDYPNIAPESPGDLFDGTEIDEILTLRILAMTDAEKREMAAVDPRAGALLERTHSLAPADLARLHGMMRSSGSARHATDSLAGATIGDARPRLASLISPTFNLAIGTQVRLRPRAGGDIMDLALKDKLAVVEAIERDFEDRIHVAVTLFDDPGRDLGAAGFPGHRFYFSQDEIEPLESGERP